MQDTADSQQHFWKTVRDGKGDPVYAFASNAQGILFAGIDSTGVLRSTDHGETWTIVNNGLSDLRIFSLAFTKDSLLYAGTENGYLYFSTDLGEHWSHECTFEHGQIRVLLPMPNGDIYASSNTHVFKKDSGSTTWYWFDTNPRFPTGVYFELMKSAAIHPKGFPYFSQYKDVVWTLDRETWNTSALYSSFRCGPKCHINTVLTSPFGYIFAGSGAGVFRSNQNPPLIPDSPAILYPGWNWREVGRIPLSATVSKLTADRYGKIFAGTCGQFGVFESIDNGESWNSVSSGLKSYDILTLHSTQEGYLFAGASDGTISKSLTSTLTLLPPITLYPYQDSLIHPQPVKFIWRKAFTAQSYRLQVSTDPSMASMYTLDQEGIIDSIYSYAFPKGSLYYWRVGSVKDTAVVYSAIHTFKVDSLRKPLIVYPENNAVNVPTDVLLKWRSVLGSHHYLVDVFKQSERSCIMNEETTDTCIVVNGLDNNSVYYWYVYPFTDHMTIRLDLRSDSNSFKTCITNSVDGETRNAPHPFALEQNFPNPFNPSTRIFFSIPEESMVLMEILDINGRIIDVPLKCSMKQGGHSVEWKSSAGSGIYFVRLTVEGSNSSQRYSQTRKMILLK